MNVGSVAETMNTTLAEVQALGVEALRDTLSQLRGSREFNTLEGRDRVQAEAVLRRYEAQLTEDVGPDATALKKQILALTQQADRLDALRAQAQEALAALSTLNAFNSWSILLDKQITDGELKDMAGWEGEVGQAARYLVDHPELLDAVRGTGGGAVQWRMADKLKELRAQIAGLEQQGTALREQLDGLHLELEEVALKREGEPKPGTTVNGGRGPGPGTLDRGEVTGSDPLGRATQRLSNSLGSLEQRMDDLVAQLGEEDDPGKRRLIEQKINDLNRLLTTVTNLLQQLMTMQQNMAKMFHDVAMGAIRNIG